MGKKSLQNGNLSHTEERISELKEEKEVEETIDLNGFNIIKKEVDGKLCSSFVISNKEESQMNKPW